VTVAVVASRGTMGAGARVVLVADFGETRESGRRGVRRKIQSRFDLALPSFGGHVFADHDAFFFIRIDRRENVKSLPAAKPSLALADRKMGMPLVAPNHVAVSLTICLSILQRKFRALVLGLDNCTFSFPSAQAQLHAFGFGTGKIPHGGPRRGL